ncbi:MAG: hypothetical protein R2865_01360 [Deinococcales bacterium]
MLLRLNLCSSKRTPSLNPSYKATEEEAPAAEAHAMPLPIIPNPTCCSSVSQALGMLSPWAIRGGLLAS